MDAFRYIHFPLRMQKKIGITWNWYFYIAVHVGEAQRHSCMLVLEIQHLNQLRQAIDSTNLQL